MNITMTKADALRIQAEQIEWYGRIVGREWLAAKVASMTTADALEDDIQYPVQILNRHIPRGGDIEHILGIEQPND